MTLTRQFAIVAVLLVTALVGQSALDPNGGTLLAQNAQDDAIQENTRFRIALGPGTLRLQSGGDGRVRLLKAKGETEMIVVSAGFDLIPTADGVRLVATGTDTELLASDGAQIVAQTFELELSASTWTISGSRLRLRQ